MRASTKAPPHPNAMNKYRYQYGAADDIGTRQEQQDYSEFCRKTEPTESLLAVLADGMGGYSNGQLASKVIVKRFISSYEQQQDSPLIRHLNEANLALAERKKQENICDESGATFIGLEIRENACRWLSVGDSYLILFREQKLSILNRLHNQETLLNEMVQRGEISIEQALNSPDRKKIYSAVCGTEIPAVDDCKIFELRAGDRIIVASDGILTLGKKLESLLQREDVAHAHAQEIAELICKLTLDEFRWKEERRLRTQQDNVSVLVVDIKEKSSTENEKKSLIAGAKNNAHSNLIEHFYSNTSYLWKIDSTHIIGDRDSQQDSYGCWSDAAGTLAVVADGAGGHAGGAMAAKIAVEVAHHMWLKQRAQLNAQEGTLEILQQCLLDAHQAIVKKSGQGNAKLSGKCAIVLCYIDINKTYYSAHAGDCRLYKKTAAQWNRMTVDDSILEILIKTGQVSEAERRTHPDQSSLTQALGAKDQPTPRLNSAKWHSDEAILLCCDGFWNQIPEVYWQVKSFGKDDGNFSLDEGAQAAWEAMKGRSDNITAVLIHLPKAGLLSRLSATGLCLILLSLLVAVMVGLCALDYVALPFGTTGKPTQVSEPSKAATESTAPEASTKAPATQPSDDEITAIDPDATKEPSDVPSLALKSLYTLELASPVDNLTISPQGDYVALVDKANQLIVFDLPSGEVVSQKPLNSATINTLRFSSDGRALAIAGSNIAVSRQIRPLEFRSLSSSAWATSIAFTPSQNSIYVNEDGKNSIKLFKLQGKQRASNIPSIDKACKILTISPNGQYAAIELSNAYIDLVEIAKEMKSTGYAEAVPQTEFSSALYAFSPNGQFFAQSNKGDSHSVSIYDVSQRSLVAQIALEAAIQNLALSPDGQLLATIHMAQLEGQLSYTLQLTSITCPQAADSIKLSSPVTAIAFSNDGRRLIIGGQVIELFEIAQ